MAGPGRRYLGIVLAVAGIAVLVGVGLLGSRASGSSDIPVGQTTDPGVKSTPTIVRIPLGGEAYDLAVSSDGNHLWAAILRKNEPDELIAIDPASRTTTARALPDSDYGGFVSRVVVAEDGSVWVSQPYRLVRFDPVTGTSFLIEFDLDADGAVTDALDPANPLPGTWVSAIATRGPWIAVARNNVALLTVLDMKLVELDPIPVPSPYAGSQDLAWASDRLLWAISGPTYDRSVALIDTTGRITEELAGGGTRLEQARDGVLALGLSNGAAQLSTAAPAWLGTTSGASDESRIAALGTVVAIYDAVANTITKFDGDIPVGILQLEEATIELRPPNGGEPRASRIRPRINDLGVDRDGNVWYLDGNAHEAVLVVW
jgi:hypothetical protein